MLFCEQRQVPRHSRGRLSNGRPSVNGKHPRQTPPAAVNWGLEHSLWSQSGIDESWLGYGGQRGASAFLPREQDMGCAAPEAAPGRRPEACSRWVCSPARALVRFQIPIWFCERLISPLGRYTGSRATRMSTRNASHMGSADGGDGFRLHRANLQCNIGLTSQPCSPRVWLWVLGNRQVFGKGNRAGWQGHLR